ncbi:cilia- and flagella-associated protein 69-like [Diprion similis]|uniref:cilia- and flagella-associated protein 69-like n=1 Tax=Diprion similis TaxID=362088 RepID=UPI001EF760D2|nr:cilia- and flagella-associated protein 69-like [Diprion similis]
MFKCRLAIAVGMFIWECIVWCSPNLRMFVERGGVYLILDIIDTTIFPVRVVFLGALCDMCDEGGYETEFCTWRGQNKELGLMSLLTKIWREEETKIRAKRTEDGCIDDLELPLMGVNQWFATFHGKCSQTTSPALEDMIGSCRPKIYAIRKILERNTERYEIAQNHYRILLQEIPMEDQITMLLIDHYFGMKQGQVWVEVYRDIHRIGLVPIRTDGEMIFLMLQRQQRRALFIKDSQDAILRAAREAELRKEKAMYKEIIDSKLAPTLDALHQIDFISRTTDPRFMSRSKNRQRAEVERELHFPVDVDPQSCHRTFLGKTNVTAIMNHQHTIQSEALVNAEPDEYKLMPVSPSISGCTTPSIVAEASDELSCRACFMSNVPCFHHERQPH